MRSTFAALVAFLLHSPAFAGPQVDGAHCYSWGPIHIWVHEQL